MVWETIGATMRTCCSHGSLPTWQSECILAPSVHTPTPMFPLIQSRNLAYLLSWAASISLFRALTASLLVGSSDCGACAAAWAVPLLPTSLHCLLLCGPSLSLSILLWLSLRRTAALPWRRSGLLWRAVRLRCELPCHKTSNSQGEDLQQDAGPLQAKQRGEGPEYIKRP